MRAYVRTPAEETEYNRAIYILCNTSKDDIHYLYLIMSKDRFRCALGTGNIYSILVPFNLIQFILSSPMKPRSPYFQNPGFRALHYLQQLCGTCAVSLPPQTLLTDFLPRAGNGLGPGKQSSQSCPAPP